MLHKNFFLDKLVIISDHILLVLSSFDNHAGLSVFFLITSEYHVLRRDFKVGTVTVATQN
jgi:hypothetical protein